MRRKLMPALAVMVVVCLGGVAIADAAIIKLKAGNLVVTFGGTMSPKALPKNEYVPITSHIFGKIETTDKTHPSAFREIAVNVDKDIMVTAANTAAR